MKQDRRDICESKGEVNRLRRRIAELESTAPKNRKIEIDLKDSDENFRAMLEGIGDSIIIIDGELNITWANSVAVDLHGELVGNKCYEGIKGLKNVCPECNTRRTFNDGITRKSEEMVKLKDETENHFLVTASPLLSSENEIIAVVETFKDITDRKRAELQLEKSLEEKNVLLREIHHRVKNNMQIISSMLTLQEFQADNEIISKIFTETRERIQVMALIHEMLYRTGSLAEIEIKPYIVRLVDAIQSASIVDKNRIEIKIVSDEIQLSTDQAIPCALAINELISNSIEHAFPKGYSGRIRIGARMLNNKKVEFSVTDNGTGIPKDLDWRNANTLGLNLVNIFVVDQLGGTIKKGTGKGTSFTFSFKKI